MAILAPNLRSVINQDGAVILNRPRNQITTLDAMGGYVWGRLEEGMSQDEVVRHLIDETGADPLTVETDVEELLKDLQSRNLIIIAMPGSPRESGQS
jgi:hypothetical protein